MSTHNPFKRQAAYEERNNLVSKSYKLSCDVVEAFRLACEKNGVSQAATLSILMSEYVEHSQRT